MYSGNSCIFLVRVNIRSRSKKTVSTCTFKKRNRRISAWLDRPEAVLRCKTPVSALNGVFLVIFDGGSAISLFGLCKRNMYAKRKKSRISKRRVHIQKSVSVGCRSTLSQAKIKKFPKKHNLISKNRSQLPLSPTKIWTLSFLNPLPTGIFRGFWQRRQVAVKCTTKQPLGVGTIPWSYDDR